MNEHDFRYQAMLKKLQAVFDRHEAFGQFIEDETVGESPKEAAFSEEDTVFLKSVGICL